MQKFKIIGKPLLGEKYVHGRRIRKKKEYVRAEGGAHLPIAHTLRLPEPTKNHKSSGWKKEK